MKSFLSNRVKTIKPSATLTLAAKTKELQAQGKDIIDLTLGEPDFTTPSHVKTIAINAINDDFTKYTAIDGIPDLKKAIIAKFKRENNLDYSLNQIIVSSGAKHSLYNLFQAILNKGDEVIIPAPFWVSYPDMVKLAEGKPVIIPTEIEQNYKISPTQLKKALNKSTKAIIINSPSNPTGAAYTLDELKQLAKVLAKHPRVLIVSDDIYEHILWSTPKFVNIANAAPDLYDRTVVVNGVSKTFAMTGWRIGYAAGNADIINAMKNIQSQSTSNPNSIAQIATIGALESSRKSVLEMVKEFKKRHDFVVAELQKIESISVKPSDGAFYVFPNIKKAMAKLKYKNDVAFSEMLLEKAGVSVVPGSSFGSPGYIRISYATSMDNLKKAIQRIKSLLA
jgi:aspartate aminotransferase